MKSWLYSVLVITLVSVFPNSGQTADNSLISQTSPQTDVVVVGGGGAGLAAAVTVAQAGLNVIVLEKMPSIGGNTLRASGLFNAVDPTHEPTTNPTDSRQRYFDQIMASGGGQSSPNVVQALVDNSYPTLKWLETLGLKFRPETLATWGAQWPRGHKPLEPRGRGYIRVLSTALLSLGGQIWTRSPVVGLLTDNQARVVGVSYLRDGMTTPLPLIVRYGVILASGGFASNAQLIRTYAPQWANLPTDNNPGNTGDLLEIAKAVGAKLVGLKNVQVVPGSPPGEPFQVRLDLDAARSILVDHLGQRFVDEDAPRNQLASAVVKRLHDGVYTITNQATIETYDIVSQRDIYKGLENGLAFRELTLQALAKRINVPADTLQKTVENFNRSSQDRTGKCARNHCVPLTHGPFWASPIFMTIHTTMGGIAINEKAQVLNEDNQPIPGLFAAGEVTGNVHGENRIGGNGITDAITFGHLAGQYLSQQKPLP